MITRKAKLLIIGFLGSLLLMSCGSQNFSTEETSKKLNSIQELIIKSSVEIENRWMTPLRGNQISLIGNPNYIRIKNDSVNIQLPYFGERQIPGNYISNGGGIQYKGLAKKFEMTQQKKEISIYFEGKHENELLKFYLTIYPNAKVITKVSSSVRDNISYEGFLKEYKKEE
ncbi:DUF4251 domain-containing protein [Mesonia maritima]|uniref:DUF4251 domain-containing protein n=1 Tax=Mesonia maritima TaxID=1793873 RepID=A0ABU1K925_9FLAO|nr:DUF4251 domain-containing protein [Mesonia maritima]MDR6302104.1 hypothetical protein [Mesonia maritima]